MSHTGRKDSGPAGMGLQVADVGGGSFGAITGILAAVIQRQLTGEGQFVDISMADMALAWNGLAASQWLVGGEMADYESDPLNGGGTYDYYRTKDQRYLAVGSLEPKFWQAFCEAIGRPDLVPAGFATDGEAEVKSQVAEVIAQKTLAEWVEVFGPLDACVEPVLTVEEALGHPQADGTRDGCGRTKAGRRHATAGSQPVQVFGQPGTVSAHRRTGGPGHGGRAGGDRLQRRGDCQPARTQDRPLNCHARARGHPSGVLVQTPPSISSRSRGGNDENTSRRSDATNLTRTATCHLQLATCPLRPHPVHPPKE